MCKVQSQHRNFLHVALSSRFVVACIYTQHLTVPRDLTTAWTAFVSGLCNGWLIGMVKNELQGTWKWSWRPGDMTVTCTWKKRKKPKDTSVRAVGAPAETETGKPLEYKSELLLLKLTCSISPLLKKLLVAYLSASRHYPVKTKWTPFTSYNPIYLVSTLILSPNLRLILPSGTFPSGFPTRIL
jgi:hypothetical protein